MSEAKIKEAVIKIRSKLKDDLTEHEQELANAAITLLECFLLDINRISKDITDIAEVLG